MKAFETSIQRKKRTALTEAIEEVIDVPREYWEVMRSKQDNEVLIRQIYIYLLNKYVGYNHQMIADLCGLKHHTSVMRNLRVADVWIASPEQYPNQNEIINNVIKSYEQRHPNTI
jgi:chromosomal replication initiation ATPase DnaA